MRPQRFHIEAKRLRFETSGSNGGAQTPDSDRPRRLTLLLELDSTRDLYSIPLHLCLPRSRAVSLLPFQFFPMIHRCLGLGPSLC